MKYLLGCKRNDEPAAVVIIGRGVNISGPTLTLSKLAELESLLRDRSAALSMHFAFVHTGTAVNWSTDPEAVIEDLLFGVVGVVVAAN
ncbi:MAG: hypothetical protein JNM74_13985, partial [Myxococcales bacterium]|nr:hypothetical protein [Myxococcales bacterium]